MLISDVNRRVSRADAHSIPFKNYTYMYDIQFQVRPNIVSSILCVFVFESIHLAAAALRLGSGFPDNGELLLSDFAKPTLHNIQSSPMRKVSCLLLII